MEKTRWENSAREQFMANRAAYLWRWKIYSNKKHHQPTNQSTSTSKNSNSTKHRPTKQTVRTALCVGNFEIYCSSHAWLWWSWLMMRRLPCWHWKAVAVPAVQSRKVEKLIFIFVFINNGWMDGWMDGWMGGWVDGWMGELMNRWLNG